MKLLPTLTALSMLFLLSCKGDSTFTLQAEMDGLADKPILVVYDDPISKLDTIFPKEGKFNYTFVPDTITLFRLVLPETGEMIPVFADKGQEMTLSGTFQAPGITGDGMNGEYGALLKEIQALKDSASAAQAAEKFIQAHPSSFASAYLINQYFIQTPSPDTKKIEQLIAPLTGNIKDSRILSVILKALPAQEDNARQNKEYVNYFSCKDREGKYISWTGEKGSYPAQLLGKLGQGKPCPARLAGKTCREIPRKEIQGLEHLPRLRKRQVAGKMQERHREMDRDMRFQGLEQSGGKTEPNPCAPCQHPDKQ